MSGRLETHRAACLAALALVERHGRPAADAFVRTLVAVADGDPLPGDSAATAIDRAMGEACVGLAPSWRRLDDRMPAGDVAGEFGRLMNRGLLADGTRSPARWLADALRDAARARLPSHPGARLLRALRCKTWTARAAEEVADLAEREGRAWAPWTPAGDAARRRAPARAVG